ncbi:MAG TPA: sigma 54-interacting transcriptional regulator [Gemmatirosa sp.]
MDEPRHAPWQVDDGRDAPPQVRHPVVDGALDTTLERSLAAILLGDSRPMRHLRAAIARLGPSALPVLITGPTGAGKELVARGLHVASRRLGGLVAFNVCAVGDALFESAVFGHVRGAFTGAVADSPGYLAEADRGTAFLDEVGALSLGAQAKLLRAVELREFRPVGAARDRRSDFRLVSATNENIEVLVRAGRFRADLAERLGGVVLDVPPLAARREDIPALVMHFAAAAADATATTPRHVGSANRPVVGASVVEFSPEALGLLQAHAWPRNVRQLRHAVERALAWSPGGCVDAATVRAILPHMAPSAGDARHRARRHVDAIGTAFVLAGRAGEDTTRSNDPDRMAAAAGEVADDAETEFARRRLTAVLDACGGDTTRAAATLGVSRATVYRRMARFGIRAVPLVVPGTLK